MADKVWFCPYFGIEMDSGACFECAMVAEEMAPLYLLPRQPQDLHEFERFCYCCEHHADGIWKMSAESAAFLQEFIEDAPHLVFGCEWDLLLQRLDAFMAAQQAASDMPQGGTYLRAALRAYGEIEQLKMEAEQR